MSQFLPNCILNKETEVIRKLADFWLPQFRINKEVRIYCVSQTRGRAYKRHGEYVVTIPNWVLRDLEHTNEYIIHELSHIEDMCNRGKSDHKEPFWTIFKRVCPQKWWHYEWNYKPGQTKANEMMMLDLFSTEDGEKFADELGEDDV